MSINQGISGQWLNSFKIKIPALLAAFFFLIISSIAVTLYIVGKDLLDEIAYDKVDQAGQTVVRELNTRITTASTLVEALANLAEQLPPDKALHQRLGARLLDYSGSENIIAGGGIWPEPYQFIPNIERHSFFWGRDKNGELRFYDDYNQAQSLGYHQEEWYVPGKYLSEGETYWSHSYIDPYSLQSMVTVATPMVMQGKHKGVATVDLKLKGLRQLLAEVTATFNGYAFVVDQKGTFLSFPDDELARRSFQDHQTVSLSPYLTVAELAEKIPELNQVNTLLEQEYQAITKTDSDPTCMQTLPDKLAGESYQIDIEEAGLIAMSLCNRGTNSFQQRQLFINTDYFLKESVFVSITTMPLTYWRIVTVMPYSSAIQPGINVYNQIVTTAAAAGLISLLVIMLSLRKFFSRLSLFSTIKKQQDNLSYILNAESMLPIPESVQSIPFIGSWKWSVEKRSLWWSEEIYHFCGKNPKIFKPTLKYFVRKIIHQDDVDNVLSIVKHAIKTQTPCGVEFRIINPDGEIKYVHVQARIILDESGNVTIIKGTVDDISRQKEIQSDLVLSATTLQNQDPVLVTDTDINIIKVNQAFTDVTGYEENEVLGKNPKFLQSGRHDAAYYKKLWASLNKDGQFEGEIWNRHKDGTVFP